MIPGIKDIIDIFLVALLLYGTYKLMRNSGAINIFVGVLSFLAVFVVVEYVLKFRFLGLILEKVVSVGAIALIILFQSEIRQFLDMLGSRQQWTRFAKWFSSRDNRTSVNTNVEQLSAACNNLSQTKTGALIVLERKVALDQYVSTGESLDAAVSSRLIENVFFKNTPLHDGAMIIRKGRIAAAACILPVSADPDIPQSFGLRHRSALGIAQQTDALAIVVSEETGHIAVAMNGSITPNLSLSELVQWLTAVSDEANGRQAMSILRKVRMRSSKNKETTI